MNNGRLLIADTFKFGRIPKIKDEKKHKPTDNRIEIIGYIDPQCFKDINYKKDKKSDIYSLGVLLWELTSGRPPFSNFDYVDSFLIALQIRDGSRETPVENTPLEYQRLYQMCWDELPASRPNIDDVHETLTKLESQFDPNKSQTVQDSSSLNNNNESSFYGNSLKMHFMDENSNQNQVGKSIIFLIFF